MEKFVRVHYASHEEANRDRDAWRLAAILHKQASG